MSRPPPDPPVVAVPTAAPLSPSAAGARPPPSPRGSGSGAVLITGPVRRSATGASATPAASATPTVVVQPSTASAAAAAVPREFLPGSLRALPAGLRSGSGSGSGALLTAGDDATLVPQGRPPPELRAALAAARAVWSPTPADDSPFSSRSPSLHNLTAAAGAGGSPPAVSPRAATAVLDSDANATLVPRARAHGPNNASAARPPPPPLKVGMAAPRPPFVAVPEPPETPVTPYSAVDPHERARVVDLRYGLPMRSVVETPRPCRHRC
jgi:hypothetical protein